VPDSQTGRIEYVIRPADSRDLGPLAEDVATLVPKDIPSRRVPDQQVLTVKRELWQVTYAARDAGWQLAFSKFATQIEAWSFVTAVAKQLETATGIRISAVQIAGFDGGIFECVRASGLESRNYLVLEGAIVSGEVDNSMNVVLPVDLGAARLQLEDISYVDRSSPTDSRLGLVCRCGDWDEVELWLGLGIPGGVLEVSNQAQTHAHVVERQDAVQEIVEPYRDLVDAISAILFRHDPMSMDYETNTDEYDPEAETIVLRLMDHDRFPEDLVRSIVHQELCRWFSVAQAGPSGRYEQISNEVVSLIEETQAGSRWAEA